MSSASTLRIALTLLLAANASAQIEDGSFWTDGQGNTCTVDVNETANPDGSTSTTVTVIDSTGFTPPVSGTAAASSTAEDPSVTSFPATTTNSTPGNEYRGKDPAGPAKPVVQKKVNGRWINLRLVKKPKNGVDNPQQLQPDFFGAPGEEGSSNPDYTGPAPL